MGTEKNNIDDDTRDMADSNLLEALDDEDIRKWFESRDPSRAKPNPFLTSDAEESVRGRASSLKIIEEDEESEQPWGVSYTQHQKHVRDVARHFFWAGMTIAFVFSIIAIFII